MGIVFAADSVPAVLAITRNTFIAYPSNVFAILGLRAVYFCGRRHFSALPLSVPRTRGDSGFRRLENGSRRVFASVSPRLCVPPSSEALGRTLPWRPREP